MKILHLTLHSGCENDIEYVFKKLGHEIVSMKFEDGYETQEISHLRGQKYWEKFKDYFATFDGIITSFPTSLSRIFLQNDWSKLLIIWVCNRIDYDIPDIDAGFYNMLRSVKNKQNVFIFGNTFIENMYSTHVKNVDIGNFIIKPHGKNIKTDFMYKTYSNDEPNVFYVPPCKNEIGPLKLSKKLDSLGIENVCEKYEKDVIELLGYKGVICIPYSWSSIAFFERLQLGLVTFVPTERFLIELFKENTYYFEPPFDTQQTELLKICEWYTQEHQNFIIYFDSWNDLKLKIEKTNYKNTTRSMLDYGKMHQKETLERWNYVINQYLQTSIHPIQTERPKINKISINIQQKQMDINVAIILTTTVYMHNKIAERNATQQIDLQKHIENYVKNIKKWLYETSLPIILVENSGYSFPELEFEKDIFKDRFEMILFNESEIKDASYLKDNHSKGTHEVFSIYHAKRQSKLITENSYNFIIKITGRFFIPGFEKYLKTQNLSNYKVIRQNNSLNCQIVGCSIELFNYIFTKRCFYRHEYAKYENDYIEILYKDKIDSLEQTLVLNCPEFNIEPTLNGKNETITSL
jgi:hypothetical protein